MNLIELIKELIEFPSYTGNEKSIDYCLNFCINYFSNNAKIFVKQIKNNGVRSVLFSNKETLDFDILEVGHIDVVPANNNEMFNLKTKNDIVYARGAGDMKSFVAIAMKLLEYVIDKNLNFKYGLLIVSDEEPGGFDGSKYWVETIGLKTKILLDADAGNELNKIIYKSKACFFVKLIAKGISSHGSKPWLGTDANDNLIKTISNIRKYIPYISKNNIPTSEWITTMHIGFIKGGEMINCIASHAEAILDFRYTEEYSNSSLLKLINSCLEEGVEVIVQEEGISVFNDINNRYLQLYKNIIEKKLNKKVVFDFTASASDTRYFTNNKETIIISNQANCGDLHGDNEWLDFKSLEDFFEIRKEFLSNIVF